MREYPAMPAFFARSRSVATVSDEPAAAAFTAVADFASGAFAARRTLAAASRTAA
jgi:hypothetical protein